MRYPKGFFDFRLIAMFVLVVAMSIAVINLILIIGEV
jgi:hypothetical protein